MAGRVIKRPPGGWSPPPAAPPETPPPAPNAAPDPVTAAPESDYDAPPNPQRPWRRWAQAQTADAAEQPWSVGEGARPLAPPTEAMTDAGDSRGRFAVAALIFATVFMVLAGRAILLAHTPEGGGFAATASAAGAEYVRRGDILDRHGEMLATSLESYSLYARREEVWDVDATVAALAGVLHGFDAQAAREALSGPRGFVWLQRGLSPRLRQAVFDLALPGLHFDVEPRRLYPRGRLAAHVLGFTNIDGVGVEGLERAFQAELSRGESVRASLDLRVQFALEEELRAALAAHNAEGAVGLVTNVRTGEILAVASLPDFDPHAPADSPADARFHRAFTGVYELGSVFKVFTYAMALDRDAIRWDETLPTTRPVIAGDVTITDPPGAPRDLTVREAFIRSSNVAAAHLGVSTPPGVFARYLENFGLLTPAPLDVAASARPLTPPNWQEPARATIAYGHGLAVSPLAFAAAFGAAVNGGLYVSPTLAPRQAPEIAPRRVVSARTSAVVTTLLREAVLEGTGRRAEAPGFEVGGKTGTAEQPGVEGYDDAAIIASFAAVFPANAPRYAVVIMVDRPQPTASGPHNLSAATVAAPVAGRLITRIAPVLGVPAQRDSAAAAAAYARRVAGESP